MQNEVAAYAACQKDERGLDKVVEDAKYRMKRYGGGCFLPLCLAFELVPFTLVDGGTFESRVCSHAQPPGHPATGKFRSAQTRLPQPSLNMNPHRLNVRIPFPPQMSLYMALAPDEKISCAYQCHRTHAPLRV